MKRPRELLAAALVGRRRWHGLTVCMLLMSSAVTAAPHEDAGGDSTVQTHHVHLSGDGGSLGEARRREHLLSIHATCASVAERRGMSVEPLVLPQVLAPQDEHVYYAINRSVRFHDGIGYQIDFERNCRLVAKPIRQTTIASYAGTCSIDRVRRTAYGMCDAAVHASAPVVPSSAERAIAAPDRDRGPEQVRDRLLAEHDRRRRANPALDPRTQGLNLRVDRVIAGLGCTTMTVADHERCLAQIRPGDGPAPHTFAPAEAPINGSFPGILLLEREDRLASIEAVAVHLDMPVADSLFAVPDGFRLLQSIPPRTTATQ